MQEEEGTFKHLKSLNDLQRESGLHHRMLQRLRSFLQDGNTIPIHSQKQQTKNKQSEKSCKKIKSAQTKDGSEESDRSEAGATEIDIDYNYVVKCAEVDPLGTCEELLIFDQRDIFAKLRKQQFQGRDEHAKPQYINDDDLMENINTRSLFIEYVSTENKDSMPASKQDSMRKPGDRKSQGIIGRVKSFFFSLLSMMKNMNAKSKKRIVMIMAMCIILLMSILGFKKRAGIGNYLKILLNLQ